MSPYLIYPAAAAAVTFLGGALLTSGLNDRDLKNKALVLAPIIAATAVASFMVMNAAFGVLAAYAVATSIIFTASVLMSGENDPKIVLGAAVIGAGIGAWGGAIGILAAQGRVGYAFFGGSIVPIVLPKTV